MTIPALLRWLVGVLALVPLACTTPPTEPFSPPTSSSFNRIESQILASSCARSGCHAGNEPTGGLRLDAGRAYEALVGVSPANSAAARDGLLRVSPGSPSTSFLLRKLNGDLAASHGARMPLGSSALDASTVEFIRQWIAAGAPRAGEVADTSLLHDAHGHVGGHFDPLPPPSHGFQLHLPAFALKPHSEREVFYALTAPIAGRTYMTGFRVAMRDNSHHFTLYSIAPGGWPLPVGVVRDRGTNNDEFLRPRSFLFGTQESDVAYSLPPGVGVAVDGGDFMDVNVHAVNPTGDTTYGEAYVNVFTTDHVDRIAEPLLWSFHQFVLPARSERTLYDTLEIAESQEMLMLTTHFHKHGRLFRVFLLDASGESMIYESRQWDHPVIGRYDTPIRLRAGDRLRLEATYDNDTDDDIYYGASAEDEMCSIFGLVVKGS